MDHEHRVIVADRPTDQVSDKGQAVVMIEETILNTGDTPKELFARAGYFSTRAVAEPHALGVDPFIAQEMTHHRAGSESAPRSRVSRKLSAQDRMRRKIRKKR